MSSIDSRCVVCAGSAGVEISTFERLARVTSDCKPFHAGGRLYVCDACGAVQKIADPTWLAEIGEIYAGYAMYAQSGGVEQAVFDPAGLPVRRSRALVEQLLESIPIPATGSMLDIGCGTGVTLGEFARLRPGWKLHGHDLDDRCLSALERIPGFSALHREPLEKISGRFDLITLVHSLEHFPLPGGALATIASLLEPGGHLLVQVPDAVASPFDLVVADHLAHFSRPTLCELARRAGFEVEAASRSWVAKELSLVARPGSPTSRPELEDPSAVRARVEAQIDWLSRTIALGEDAMRRSRHGPSAGGPVAIFGCSIAGAWAFGALSEPPSLFVDEDGARVGSQHLGVPIVHPRDLPRGTTVLVPLLPAVANAVAARYADLDVSFVTPPELPQPTEDALHA